MIPGLTLSVLSTGVFTGRPAVVVVAGAVQGTLAVVDALSPGAADERVSPVSGRTGAHRTVHSRPVEPCLAVSTGTTGVRTAQVSLLELAATHEGVSGVASRAGADRLVVRRLAGRSLTAHVRVRILAGIATLQSDTGLI